MRFAELAEFLVVWWARSRQRWVAGGDRGDVPGWVLVTLMTAGLVVGLWAVAGPRLEALFTQAMDAVVGQL